MNRELKEFSGIENGCSSSEPSLNGSSGGREGVLWRPAASMGGCVDARATRQTRTTLTCPDDVYVWTLSLGDARRESLCWLRSVMSVCVCGCV